MANEQSDKEMHDWLRQTLHDYLPEGNPQADWEKLLPKIKHRPVFIWWFLGGLLLFFGISFWFYFNKEVSEKQIVTNEKIKNNIPQKLTIWEPLISLKTIENIPKKKIFIPIYKDENNLVSTPLKIVSGRENNLISIDFLTAKSLTFSMPIFPKPKPEITRISPEESEIKYQMLTGDFGEDSTAYRALNRNINAWANSVIVADLTTSMYPYSTQIFAWMNKNLRNKAIKGTVFFTDCDSLGNQTQVNGRAGKMYSTKERSPLKALDVMIQAAENTAKNEDFEENDLEALLYTQNEFPEAKHLILIADNRAAPKDMYLLPKLKKPVHVILCGVMGDSTLAFHPQYLEIAMKTKGSIHTLEDDLKPEDLDSKTVIKVGKKYYRYIPRREQFKLTRFENRPFRILGFLWL